MTPPARIAWGLVLVIIDLRFNGLDLVPDLLGWLLVIWGVVPLRGRSRWFDLAGACGLVGAVMSVPLLVAEPGGALRTVEIASQTALVFGVCSGIRAIAGQEPVARTANAIRWLDLGLAVVLLVASAGVGTPSPWTVAWVLALAVVSFGVVIWFLVLLFRLSGHPALQERQPVA